MSANPNKCFDGNRPNCVILARKLDPYTMGALLALYEHKVRPSDGHISDGCMSDD